jgi:AFG3 family protein
VSIVPRGTAALGFAQYLPNENMLVTTEQLEDMMAMALGGRAAEQVMLGRISTGAQNDLERVTKMAYSQVAIYGMNPKIGLLSFPPEENQLHKPYSDDTARLIDGEVRSLVDAAYQRTVKLLEEKKELVERMAVALLDKEVLGTEELETLLGPRPYRSAELRNIDKFKDGFKPEGTAAAAAEEEEGGKAHVPPPPTDTPAGDLALAAKQLDSEQAATGPGAFHAQAEPAAEQQLEGEQQPAAEAAEQPVEGEAEEGQQQKKRPRIVAT